jgi:DNA-binding transcriptional MerR regulator
MEQLTNGILQRSSDAVVIIGLADGRILDLNEAFFTLTDRTRHELVGRPWRDLLVDLGRTADPAAGGVLNELGSLADQQIGLWTRSGELRVGELSVLALEFEGQRDALCTIRQVRDPTPGQRRSAAREELHRLLGSGATQPEAATKALRAFGRCLRWEIGALWRGTPSGERLRCVTEWHARPSGLEPVQEPSRYPGSSGRLEAPRRAWLRLEPTWIPDVLADPELAPDAFDLQEPTHGWLGFPALGADGVIGVVEFLSREIRQPDAELLAMSEDFGRLFGRLLELVDTAAIRFVDRTETARPGTEDPALGAMPAAFRDLAGAVAAATEALEQHPTVPTYVPPSAMLGELRAEVGRLNQLLEHAVERGAGAAPGLEPPPAPSGEATGELPTGLTLKAVSRRTGIPAATLRTWEHRYGFMHPRRSPSGYRLYGTEEIARIERVKYLVGQGVRLGAAMRAVIEGAGGDAPGVAGRQSLDRSRPGEEAKHAEVYRLDPRSSRRGRSGSGPDRPGQGAPGR